VHQYSEQDQNVGGLVYNAPGFVHRSQIQAVQMYLYELAPRHPQYVKNLEAGPHLTGYDELWHAQTGGLQHAQAAMDYEVKMILQCLRSFNGVKASRV
jgi:hypothetical protein